ncbi:MAG: hypothetical protein DSY89_06360 [Deltaproteobacteria bacterium]|nr:MAG: hypothetical protein DSY89_06360 [Deltaproteobacteria bacterium]
MILSIRQLQDNKLSISFFNRLTASLPGAIIYSILAGVIGALILMIYLGGMVATESLMKWIPWILGFNTAITGYSLIDKTMERLHNKRIYAVGSGVIVVVTVCLVLTLTSEFGNIVTPAQLAMYGIIGVIFSGFGAWVSIKRHHFE